MREEAVLKTMSVFDSWTYSYHNVVCRKNGLIVSDKAHSQPFLYLTWICVIMASRQSVQAAENHVSLKKIKIKNKKGTRQRRRVP
ncbi:MAG: hypothetical protein CMM27_12670 [Rhodospirillaceae bacterium]|nr:hypothetical protein [Rhodospirillaceae bacterium]